MVTHRDVIITVLGAAAGLAGLFLVFLGVVLTTAQSLPAEVPRGVRRFLRWQAFLTLVPFTVGVASVGLSTGWLLTNNNQGLYISAVACFIGQLVLLLPTAFILTWRMTAP